MENDYDKFFYTYEAVEPPKYTKINLDKILKNKLNNFSNPYFKDPTTRSYSPVLTYVFNQNTDEQTNDEQTDDKQAAPMIIPNFSNSSKNNNIYYNDALHILRYDENKNKIAANIHRALQTEMNWDDLQISALLGNAMQESSFDINKLNKKSSAYGLFLFLSDTTNTFNIWDNNHPEYKEKYPDEYVRQALWIADSINNKNTSVIMDEESQDNQSWNDWNSKDLSRMSKALKRMFFRSGSSDNSYYQRSEYSRAMYDAIQEGNNIIKQQN